MILIKTTYTLDKTHMPITSLDCELQQVDPIVLDILYRRGYRTSSEIREILFPRLDSAIRPLVCRDIEAALSILEKAVVEQTPIVVYRDYDVDGIASGAVAVEALGQLGAVVHHYVNMRNVDGFGICKNGIDTIMKQWPETKIILTVDNGISGIEAIAYANSRGLTVIVTDHHEPDEQLPPAAAIVDLKRSDEIYPYHDLCGCGVIFRVMLDLYRRMRKDPTPVLQTLDMVALATIADVVPLLGENRAYVKEGIKLIESGNRLFFRAMLKLLESTEVTAHGTLAFQIAPILNSLSRLGEDTSLAVEALLSNDSSWVEGQCISFLQVNQKRKELTQEQYELALSMIAPDDASPAIILYNQAFDAGIIGIIAGRLKEQFGKPCIVLGKDNAGDIKGSARGIDGFDLKGSLDKCSHLLIAYGGHVKAAGLSLEERNLPKFRAEFMQVAAECLNGDSIKNEIALAAVLTEDILTEQFVRNLRILEPYGEGFPEPIFGLIAHPDSVRYMGSENQHVKFGCSASGLSVIAWKMADKARKMSRFPEKFIGRPRLNMWNHTISVQFVQES